MRVLSIDLPWSGAGVFGFAYADVADPGGPVVASELPEQEREVEDVFAGFGHEQGRFDLILLDHPIGEAAGRTKGYRPVERAVSNSAFAGRRRIQCPRFQPGAEHMAAGLTMARAAQAILGTPRAVVVESFPQLSVPALLQFAEQKGLPSNGIYRLNAHKTGAADARSRAQREMLGAFERWTGWVVEGLPPSSRGGDGLDAVIGLLPALQLLNVAKGPVSSSAWTEVVWLHDWPLGTHPLPGEAGRVLKAEARSRWMSPLAKGVVGQTGVRVDGLISMRLPGWLAPAAEERIL
jgi:hypothetical protein